MAAVRLCHVLEMVCFLALSLSARAADRYVSTSGFDTDPGTFEQPWRTIQKAADSVLAGDTVFLRGNGGVYSERVTLANKDGTAAQPITFRTWPGDPMAVIDQSGVTPPSGLSALFTILNSDYVTLQEIEFRNYKTAGTNAQQKQQTPAGIYIHGDGRGIQVRGCKVHDIWQSCATLHDFAANGLGIAVYGNSATPIDGFVLDGNEVHNLRTGASESVVLNGNVTNFTVTNNAVHDCNNIGIDFIGFEGTAPTEALDQARGGLCALNEVFNIDSKFNPAYGGNFTTGGGNATRSAPGIYVDGGRDITVERNHVRACNFAVSVASEHAGKAASNVIVRNNILHHCHVGGIVMGGADSAENGGTQNCSFTHNTLYDNDTVGFGGGQVMIQHYVTGTSIQRNLMAATAGFVQFVLKDNTTGSFAANAIDWNLYRHNPGASYEFIWNGTAYASFANWRNAGGLAKDANSQLTTASLALTSVAPSSASPAADFALTSTSPAKDTGDSVASPFTPAAGEKDYFGQNRVTGGRVDIGADEFMTPGQAWRTDFNQDGKPDLVWRHDSGAICAWFMNGINILSGTFFNPSATDPSWRISAVGDFNADDKPDLVWRHDGGAICVWFMDGINLVSSSFLNPNLVAPSWKIAGVEDFNQDGKPDLVWREDSGVVGVWFMDGINLLSGALFNPSQTDPSWKIAAVGDFNQDGKPDLVWRQDSGVVGVWFMDGINLLSTALFNPGKTDPSWRVSGVGDFNLDGKTDLIWSHDSGALYAWFMDGINFLSGSFFNPAQVDPTWKIPSP